MNFTKKLLGVALMIALVTPVPAMAADVPGFSRPSALDPMSNGSYVINPPTSFKFASSTAKFWRGEAPALQTLTSATCTITSGALPTGLSLGTISTTSQQVTCPLSGDTDNASGTYAFTFTMTLIADGTTYSTTENYSVVVGSAGTTTSASQPQPEPAKYSGPEFSSLSLRPVMQGSSTTLSGKRLSEISSIEIGGKAATITPVSDSELKLSPASGLAPGNYDLVVYSPSGKLTHINAVRVQAPLKAFSITSVSEGRMTEEQYYEHSLISSMQQPELNKARCVVNAASLAQARAQAERLCALVAGSNPNIKTTIVEPKSTVKGTKVFARVTYGWSE